MNSSETAEDKKSRWKEILFAIVFLFFFFIVFLSFISRGWLFYNDGPYRGKVVDLKTGKPIEGAVVAGVWGLELYGGPGGSIGRFCDADEALTDGNGEFVVPRAFCFHWWPLTKLESVQFTVFKPGYLGYPPLDTLPDGRRGRMPDFTGEEFRDKRQYYIIKLGKPKTKEERYLTLHRAESVFDSDKEFERLPNLLKLTNEENIYQGFEPRNLQIEGGSK